MNTIIQPILWTQIITPPVVPRNQVIITPQQWTKPQTQIRTPWICQSYHISVTRDHSLKFTEVYHSFLSRKSGQHPMRKPCSLFLLQITNSIPFHPRLFTGQITLKSLVRDSLHTDPPAPTLCSIFGYRSVRGAFTIYSFSGSPSAEIKAPIKKLSTKHG